MDEPSSAKGNLTPLEGGPMAMLSSIPSKQYTSWILISSRKGRSTMCYLAVCSGSPWADGAWFTPRIDAAPTAGAPPKPSGYRRRALKLPWHGEAGLTQPEIHPSQGWTQS